MQTAIFFYVRPRCRSPPASNRTLSTSKIRLEERQMALYAYDSVTGSVEIDVDKEWADWLTSADNDELNGERSHVRPDHKYAPGEPVSIDSLDYLGEWIKDQRDEIGAVELSVDMSRALQSLAKLQRRYLTLTKLKGYSYTAIALLDGKNESTIRRLTESAMRRIKNFFE